MRKKILVVDDEPHIVKLLKINLEQAGYLVVTAADGIEALEQVKLEKPDLITLDIRMPGKDGWQVINEIKQDPKTRDIPIFVISQCSDVDSVVRGFGEGVVLYLTKPFNPLEVIQFVTQIFNQPEQSTTLSDLCHLN